MDRNPQLRWDVEIGPRTVDEKPEEVQNYKYEVQNDDFREWRRFHGAVECVAGAFTLPVEFSMVTAKTRMRKHLRAIQWFAAALVAAVMGWYVATPTYDRSHYSPRHVYRLDYYNASWLQRLLHRDFHHPHVVRLYRIEPETLLGESEVVDLWLNGEIYWWLKPPVNAVQVGSDVVFENIPPECTDCPPLTDAQMMP